MARPKEKNSDQLPENTTTEEAQQEHRYKNILSSHQRDEYGLLNNTEYSFNSDGTINWRNMIQKEYLVPNRDFFKNKNINLKELEVSLLPDNQLLILLGGIKELAQIRGFNRVEYDVIDAGPEYVAVKCTIHWIPNFETNNQEVIFSSLADAHLENTKDFAKNFLMAIAENRAFIRCVRNFLKINIVGNEEMGKSSTNEESSPTPFQYEDSPSNSKPIALLKKTMLEHNISFEQIRDRAIQKNMENANNWQSIEDISPLAMFTIVSGIKNKNRK